MREGKKGKSLHTASFRRQISMNCLMSETSLGMMARVRDVEERILMEREESAGRRDGVGV